ncbi:LOB domain-containing protein 27-like [Rhododendron vialii]|uniref:LOB domain-containing protein 27-like n=1 Tax=Rhododendron vialii TaxID=182163 RepID=UPI00265E7D7F|nr:LOB domain-containing protein 27-like [Rhododendron vialii]
MTLKGGTSQACAACRFQRRKCTDECQLKPYFPADNPKIFQNAHKLFGVCNIVKILKKLDQVQKMEAMRSIIFQAEIREKYPVHGCCGVISQLQYQIRHVEEELYAVLAQIAFFRQQSNQQNEIESVHDSTSQIQALSLFHQEAAPPQQQPPVNALPMASHQGYPNCNNVVAYNNSGYLDKDNVVNSLWVQNPYSGDNNSINNPMVMQSQLVPSSQLNIQQEPAQEYDEMHPFFDTIDDRQSYIDSKDAYDSSSDSSLKDTTQSVDHVADNELKSAAACFRLTSVN